MSENKDNGKRVGAYTEFGWFLRTARNSIGVKNQEEMAKAIGYSKGFLSDLEKGTKGSVHIDFLLRCRDYFGWGIQEGDSLETKQYKIGKTFELFKKGLMDNPRKFSVDMNIFQNMRKEIIAEVITALLLVPDYFTAGVEVTEGVKPHRVHEEEVMRISKNCKHMERLCFTHAQIRDLESPLTP